LIFNANEAGVIDPGHLLIESPNEEVPEAKEGMGLGSLEEHKKNSTKQASSRSDLMK